MDTKVPSPSRHSMTAYLKGWLYLHLAGADDEDILWAAPVLGRGVRFGGDKGSRGNGNMNVKRPTG